MAEPPTFTPVDLLTGFLGSGKTTLLSNLLADPALADTAVLINEFGEVALDHHLVRRIDDDVVVLASGCVCCTVRRELAEALRDLHSRRARGLVPCFTRVLIETTGLADPFPLLSTLRADPVVRHHFRPGRVLTTVDAVNGAGQLDTYLESNRQAAAADCLILTKTDLTTDERHRVLVDRLRGLNPDASILDARAASSIATLLAERDATGRPSASGGFYCEESRDLVDADGRAHGAAFRSFVLTLDEAVDWAAFGVWLTMLLNRHGEKVLRVKGILNLVGEDRPIAVHGVQHLVHTPVHLDAWPSDDRRSHIVFIVDGLDVTLLKRSFAAFVVAARVGATAHAPHSSPEPIARHA